MASASKQLRWLVVLTGVIMIMPAYGYLDGNSGSIIVQALLGGAAGIAAIGKLYWHKLKTVVLRLFGKTPAEVPAVDTDLSSPPKNDAHTERHDKP